MRHENKAIATGDYLGIRCDSYLIDGPVEPKTRFELVTSALPWRRSTN